MLWPHPSRRRLTRWARLLDDARIQVHVEQCERCLAVVEKTEPAEEVALGTLLRTFLSAPDSLEQELVERAETARARRASLEILGGLAALPWETLRLMIGDEGSDEHD
ncbi:MAG: hypothetical protein KJP22_04435 [Acidimicrobiia bacterium]|nr:hypothetical protein [Acidimicrobiia bacterium]MBT8192626.1 hypothetical protein [Acidimicrobiia bacterium]NNF88906.1 hypothetical protein [Acidimicrobiia bacterium]NNL14559.1 hypothetical protein [Acidimicrobiia bacterium]NNL70997.1 hypothetical protein [Acidimicrobiia bacterium]